LSNPFWFGSQRGLDAAYSQDLKREFVEELIYPAIQANCIYEVPSFSPPQPVVCHLDVILQNVYLLGTSLARPVIARGMIEVAAKEGCECVV